MVVSRALVAIALCIAACGDDDTRTNDDAGPRDDARIDLDSGLIDAGPSDATIAMDSGAMDARADDGGADAGTCEAPPPGPVPCLGDGCEVLLVASGDRHSCVVLREGFVYCWGANEAGQLGDRTTCDRATPVRARGIEGAIEVVAGATRTCARMRDGTATCWGAGATEPIAIDATDVSGIAVGDAHACVIAGAEGRVRCFGDSTRAELGVVRDAPSDVLVEVPLPAGARRIAAGAHHTCVRSIGDAEPVACWGDDRFGQRGSGSVHAEPIAEVAIPALDAVPTAVIAGRAHTCTTSAGGMLRCWGDAATGAIGSPAMGIAPEPRAVSAAWPATPVAFAAHGDLTCALLAGGAVACMGDGASGQLAGADVEPGEPAAITGVSSAVQVAPGRDHVCVLAASGEVICWGTNDRGQLGRGATGSTALPSAVIGLPVGE